MKISDRAHSAQVFEVPAFRAECLEVACGWKGPYRPTRYDAAPDLELHQCESACDCKPFGGQHVGGCASGLNLQKVRELRGRDRS